MQATTHVIELAYGLSAFEVGERLRLASDNMSHNKRALAFYFVDMDDRRLYLQSGHSCTAHFGDAQLDFEPRRTRELMQVGRALQNLELVDDALRAGEISWSKSIALLPVVQRETQAAWVEFAKTHTCRELREEVGGCRPGFLPGEGDYGLIRKRHAFGSKFEDVHYAKIERARAYLSMEDAPPLSDAELILELLQRGIPEEVLAAPTESKKPLPIEERNNEELPPEIRAEVLRRDHNRCRNCHNHLDVEVHHVEERSFGGNNDTRNLATLCSTCHSLVHRGLLQVHGNPEAKTLCFTSAAGIPVNRGGHPPSESSAAAAGVHPPPIRESASSA